MRFASLLALLPVALAASHVKVDGSTCTVTPIGGGQDDGPNIIRAFDACKSGGTIVLDRYYVVNTVLVITGLQDVKIEFSSVGASRSLNTRSASIQSTYLSAVQYTANIAYWSPNSYYMEFQNAYVVFTEPCPTVTRLSTTFWFISGNNIHLYGGGTLDANGQIWWDYPNKVTSLLSHTDRPSHIAADCGNRRWFFHLLCTTSLPHCRQRLECSCRRSHRNRFPLLGTSHFPTCQPRVSPQR